MFGYVKINKQELLVKDYETYRAVYCGLCKALGRRYSVFSRMSLNYEYTLYALIRLAVQAEEPAFDKQGCLFNPLCRNKCCLPVKALDEAADALVLTTWFKLADDLSDSGFFKRIAVRLLRLVYRPMAAKARKAQPDLWVSAENYMKQQEQVEKAKEVNPDVAAEPTARFLSDLLERAGRDNSQRRVLAEMGYNMGKWIYWMDAADDLLDDLKQGKFNPWISAFSLTSPEEIKPSAVEAIRASLNACINETAKAVDLLAVKRYEMILKNIIYLGLPKEQERVLCRLHHPKRKKGHT